MYVYTGKVSGGLGTRFRHGCVYVYFEPVHTIKNFGFYELEYDVFMAIPILTVH